VTRRTITEDSGAGPFALLVVLWVLMGVILAVAGERDLFTADRAAWVVVQWIRILLAC
jgi:hypothetical protein